MTHSSFELSKAPARIESITFGKGAPKDGNDEGAGIKKLKLWIDVTKENRIKKVVPLFPGIIDEHTPQKVANEQAPGTDLRSKRKLGVAIVKIHDPQGDVLFESSTARVGQPRLTFSKEAKIVWLILDIEMAVPKKAVAALDDYFKADVLATVGVAQLDLEDAAKEKAKAKEEELAAKQVTWLPKDPTAKAKRPKVVAKGKSGKAKKKK